MRNTNDLIYIGNHCYSKQSYLITLENLQHIDDECRVQGIDPTVFINSLITLHREVANNE